MYQMWTPKSRRWGGVRPPLRYGESFLGIHQWTSDTEDDGTTSVVDGPRRERWVELVVRRGFDDVVSRRVSPATAELTWPPARVTN